MKADYKKYRKVPPYMTKTGIQIGLLYQEPFETRIDKDAYRIQEALLFKKAKTYKQPIHYGDLAVGVVSVIGIIAIIVLEVMHVL
jgi:hypothetical protein